jgi:NADH-quinone oxidoreductase subunit J
MGAVGVITSLNAINAVLWLIFVFCQAAGIFMLLGAEFISMLLIIVYVGAVAVLFLFTVMMLDIKETSIRSQFFNNRWLNYVLSAGVLLDVALIGKLIVSEYQFTNRSAFVIAHPLKENVNNIGMVLYTDFFLPFQLGGFILFLAMLGCVALTLRETKPHRSNNNINIALLEKRKVVLVKPKVGGGLTDE